MADVTRLPRGLKITHQRTPQPLTSATRALVWKIQDLCIDVSLHSPTHVADCQYHGATHELTVRVVPRDAIHPGGTFAADWSDYLYLPGREQGGSTPNIGEELGNLYQRLLAYLPPSHTPGGAA